MVKGSYVVTQDINKAAFWKEGTQHLLSRLDIELTERCNNNCLHCCINLPEKDLVSKRRELSTESLKNILKEAVSLGCLTVRFTGGEPFLREDFEELYLFTRKLGLKVLLFTNATLINEHYAELFRRIPPKERIEVTVYGMRQCSYEAVTRVKGSFAHAWQGINLLLANKVPFIVKGAFLKYNQNEVFEFERWASTIPWMDKPPSYSIFFDLRCRRDEAKNSLIRSVRIDPEEGLKFLTRRKDKYIKEMKAFCAKFIRPPGDNLFSCGSGKGGGCVDAYGYFQPCMMLRHPDTIYDLRSGSLKEALTRAFPAVRRIKAVNKDYLKRCANCFLKGLCEQCPAKSWMEYGTLDTPVDYLCQVAHLQARFLGLLKEGELSWEVKNWRERIQEFSKNN